MGTLGEGEPRATASIPPGDDRGAARTHPERASSPSPSELLAADLAKVHSMTADEALAAMTGKDDDRRKAEFLFSLGYEKAEIARNLNRPYGTVHAWLDPERAAKQKKRRKRYQRPCPRCGTPMDGSGGFKTSPKLCMACSHEAERENRYWTQERVIEAIQRWALTHDGVPPTASMWLRKTPKGIPPVAMVMREFGSWAAGIEAAGFARPRTGHYDRTGTKGLVPLQRDVLDLLAWQGPLAARQIGDMLRMGYPGSTLLSLERRGLVVREGRGGKSHPFVWRLALP